MRITSFRHLSQNSECLRVGKTQITSGKKNRSGDCNGYVPGTAMGNDSNNRIEEPLLATNKKKKYISVCSYNCKSEINMSKPQEKKRLGLIVCS